MHYKKYKTILSPKNGMNIYRGCSHGCIYCDSRSKCYQMQHDFEDIEVKQNAPEMLGAELLRKRKKCMIGTGSMCDPYIHLEEELMYTRRCLDAIERQGFGLSILTKSSRILRDLDLLKRISDKTKCVVQMTLTTYDEDLCRIIEPYVSGTKERLETLNILRDNDIPTIVWLTPILPYLNDTEENLRGILSYCIQARVKGIICFGMGVTLREGDREYLYSQFDKHFPGLKQRYIKKFGYAYECYSDNSDRLMKIFRGECKAHGILYDVGEIFGYMREFPTEQPSEQLSFFELS